MRIVLQKKSPAYARGRFVTQLNFVVSLLAATIGLGDVLRFPAFVLKQRESSILVPFLLVVVFVGIPLVALELFLGQFTSTGPATCWAFAPIFRGVGFGSVLLGAFTTIYYQVNLAVVAFYLFQSITLALPWKHCDRHWASDLCLDFVNESSADYCRDQGWNVSRDGACYNDTATPRQIKSIWNTSLAGENKIKRVLPAADYFHHFVQGLNKPGISLYNLGYVHLGLFGCLVFVWTVTALALAWGLNSLVRLLYIALIYTLFALILQLIFSMTMDEALEGINLLFSIDFEALRDKTLWINAANQAFFTLSVNTGILLTLASFNNFRGDCCTFATVMAGGNVGISFLSGCITFAALGSIPATLRDPFHKKSEGEDVGFIIYPYTLARMEGGAAWSGIFFLMIFVVGISSSTVYVQTVYTTLLDLYPLLRHYKTLGLVVMCSVYCLLGLPLVTDGGHHFIEILSEGLYSFDIFVLSFTQVIALAWVYGVRNFLYDISFMVGENVLGVLPWKFFKYGFVFSWSVLCPGFTAVEIVILLHKAFSAAGTVQGAMKLTISCIILLPIPICAVYALLGTKGSCLQKLKSACQPTENWGPALPKERSMWRQAGPQGTKPTFKSGVIKKQAAGSINNAQQKPAVPSHQVRIASLSTDIPIQIVMESARASTSYVDNRASDKAPIFQNDQQGNPADSWTDDPHVFPTTAVSNQYLAEPPAHPPRSPGAGEGPAKSFSFHGVFSLSALNQVYSNPSLVSLTQHLLHNVEQQLSFSRLRYSAHKMDDAASLKSDNVDDTASKQSDNVDDTAGKNSDNVDDTAKIKSMSDDIASLKSVFV